MANYLSPLALVLFYALLVSWRVTNLSSPPSRCRKLLGLTPDFPMSEIRSDQGGGFPNFVYLHEPEGEAPTVCKAMDFDSFIPKPLTFLSFVSNMFVKFISLGHRDSSIGGVGVVPQLKKISFWDFVMLDSYVQNDGSTSGYVGGLSTSPTSPSSPLAIASHTAHCKLLAMGFVDLDAHILHNVVVEEGEGEAQNRAVIVDVDSVMPVYVWKLMRKVVVEFEINVKGGIFDVMDDRKASLACMEVGGEGEAAVAEWSGFGGLLKHLPLFWGGVFKYIGIFEGRESEL